MRRLGGFAIVVVLSGLLTAMPAAADPALPYVEGPDVPTLTGPEASVRAFADERFSYTEGVRHRTVAIPALPAGPDDDGLWDRVILTFSGRTDGDPWDRLFGVSVGGVELLRGTTPRTAFTVTKDVTEYAALFQPGQRTTASLLFGTWVGGQLLTVDLAFYDDEDPPRPAVDRVLPAFAFRGLGGDGATQSAVVKFPAAAPTSAVLEVGMSGHGQTGEFWYQDGTPRNFSITVDGREVATVTPMPYVYALIGTNGTNGDNGPAFWSAHRALDMAGVHTGWGIVPPYRATLDASEVALLRGAKTVQIRQTAGGYWPTSISFLLDGLPAEPAPVGAVPVDAIAVRDGGVIAAGDPLTVVFDAPVTCSGAAPSQLTYSVGEGQPVAAASIACDGTATVRATLPDGAAHEISHGAITYTAAEDPSVRITAVGGGDAASPSTEPVLVSASTRPFLVGAGAAVEEGLEHDIVTVWYSQPVGCSPSAAEGFAFGGQRAVYAECDDTQTLVLVFPPGTVDALPEDRVLRATGVGITSMDGVAATGPDEEVVGISVPG